MLAHEYNSIDELTRRKGFPTGKFRTPRATLQNRVTFPILVPSILTLGVLRGVSKKFEEVSRNSVFRLAHLENERMRQSEALNEFEAAVLAALAQSPEKPLLAADLVRGFRTRASRSSCIARIEQMERRGRVRTSRFAGRILIHPPVEE